MRAERAEIDLAPAKVEQVLLGVPCPTNCGGELQVYKSFREKEPVMRIACYKCGQTVDQDSIVVSFGYVGREGGEL